MKDGGFHGVKRSRRGKGSVRRATESGTGLASPQRMFPMKRSSGMGGTRRLPKHAAELQISQSKHCLTEMRDISRKGILRTVKSVIKRRSWSGEEPFQVGIASMKMVVFSTLQNDAAPRNPDFVRPSAIAGLSGRRGRVDSQVYVHEGGSGFCATASRRPQSHRDCGTDVLSSLSWAGAGRE